VHVLWSDVSEKPLCPGLKRNSFHVRKRAAEVAAAFRRWRARRRAAAAATAGHSPYASSCNDAPAAAAVLLRACCSTVPIFGSHGRRGGVGQRGWRVCLALSQRKRLQSVRRVQGKSDRFICRRKRRPQSLVQVVARRHRAAQQRGDCDLPRGARRRARAARGAGALAR
jgi:hypothetical protein